MTSAALVATRVPHGYNVAARNLGRTTTHYRPNGATAPLVAGNIVQTTLAAFDTVPEFTFVNPQKFGNVTYYAMMDATLVQVGDYLVQGAQPYFVATVDDYAAPMVIRCDRVLTVKRPAVVSGSYSGDIRGNETSLIAGWPAACVQNSKGERGDAGLPGDTRAPWWTIELPASVPVQLRSSDVAEDNQTQPMRFVFSSVEPSALGLRITAAQTVA